MGGTVSVPGIKANDGNVYATEEGMAMIEEHYAPL
jgi:hypothetical protein